MTIVQTLQKAAIESLQALYNQSFTEKDFQVSQTKPEFEGNYTVVLFSLVKSLKKSPEVLGNELGEKLIKDHPGVFSKYNVIKGFLNLTITDNYLLDLLNKNYNDGSFGKHAINGKRMMVEYSSPNTNKPLHLGHLRNNFLGWSVAEILKANGYDVIKTCIVNDRGIHICKSMIAWQLFGNGETPESTGEKGDHLVGKYYVRFNDEYKKQVEELISKGISKDEAEKQAPLMQAAQQMLLDWENHKPEVIALWNKMNGWVYDGFDVTYKRIGSDFDKTYYESKTYLLGKDFVQEGLQKGILFKKEDGSVWIDLTDEGLDEKLLLRSDGTSVYMTQDIGLAKQKYEEYKPGKSIYVIGDEQNYHMKVLKLVCKKLGMPFADGIYHLSYGMVELPTGKMKSREGTVVDADDMVDEMIATAKHHTEELGKVKDFESHELQELYETLGLGAMKFYLLRVDPKKRMVFNPEESIDFHGFTGPFVQYTYARIQSVLRKAGQWSMVNRQSQTDPELLPLEKELILTLEQYSQIIEQAATELNPSVIANYIFHLAKTFNSFYTEHSIANAESEEKKQLRLHIATMTANVIKSSMQLLGIKVPERM
ncbi:MAG: arginine--tRNA ligase [Chitinophagaceae bacterium]|nr:arginine--tRNA ligase [Chitinophagaceae bacterium]